MYRDEFSEDIFKYKFERVMIYVLFAQSCRSPPCDSVSKEYCFIKRREIGHTMRIALRVGFDMLDLAR
jgi:hypothetical protein